ncbi:MAG: hypothetical protein N2379_04120 [Verrucomicrobiae bacterium]|nr:hypothetical protein [Verrucomicrobiae bacterium]MDW7979478.1 hypothetical protein [Verrucomicrobiales bacterium]
MSLVKWIGFLRARMRTLVWGCVTVLVAIVVLDAIPSLVSKEHAHTTVERVPGFWALFGFAGCALLVFGSKLYGRAGIVQPEDYYVRKGRRDTSSSTSGTQSHPER